MQDEIWHQYGIQTYNGAVLSVYSVDLFFKFEFKLEAKKWPLTKCLNFSCINSFVKKKKI